MKDSRRLITTKRIFKNGFINFGRNIWLAIAAIAMMTITLTILLIAVVANATFRNTIQTITDKIDVSVFLKDSVSDKGRDDITKQLYEIPSVKSVEHISKAEALRRYKEQNANNKDLLNAIAETDNPLSAELHVKPTDPNELGEIKKFLDRDDIAAMQSDPPSYSGDRKVAIDKIAKATKFFEKAGIVGIVIFTIISMLIIFNTIRMAIFNRRDEITIMRLLGANTWYIRGPFVVETMLYGAVAAIISLIIASSLFAIASSTLEASSLGLLDIGYSHEFFTNHLWLILTMQIATGIIIGAVSSAIATRRYLKLHRQ